jgi:hypothetical protein
MRRRIEQRDATDSCRCDSGHGCTDDRCHDGSNHRANGRTDCCANGNTFGKTNCYRDAGTDADADATSVEHAEPDRDADCAAHGTADCAADRAANCTADRAADRAANCDANAGPDTHCDAHGVRHHHTVLGANEHERKITSLDASDAHGRTCGRLRRWRARFVRAGSTDECRRRGHCTGARR